VTTDVNLSPIEKGVCINLISWKERK